MAIRKEDNRTWTVYGHIPKGLDGKDRYYKRRGFKTRREAKIAELKILEDHRNISPTHMTLNDLIKEYHKDAPTHIKESTLKGYERIERQVLIPTFGNKYIDKLTTFEIQRWINNIFKNGVNGKKYHEETIKGYLLHLSGLLTYAVKHDWLIKNPCSSVIRPRDPNKRPNEKSSRDNYWEIDEFCFYTGLRIGEFCALQWKHINLENGTITVEQSLSAITSKITTPKTGNSYRTIKVPTRIIEKLKLKYEYVSRIRDFTNDWFIFNDKTYISIGTVRRCDASIYLGPVK